LRLEATEKRIAEIEQFLQKNVPAQERQAIVSEVGVRDDYSAAFSHDSGPQDATVHVVLSADRTLSAREYAARLRRVFAREPKFADLRARFQADGMSAPLDIRITGGEPEDQARLARAVCDRMARIRGAADVEVVQRQDAPLLVAEVDRQKAADVGLSAPDVMLQVVAALSANIPSDRNFWVDAATGNQYFVAVQYPEDPGRKLEDALNVNTTGANQRGGIKLGQLVTLRRTTTAMEIDHADLRRVFDVRADVEGRNPRDVADDVEKALKDLPVPGGMRIEIRVEEPQGKN
jgi:multidrug efflux pump subunit AcrB